MFISPTRALMAALMLAGAAAPSLAAPGRASIVVEDAWCPPTPPGAPTAAGYLTLRNLGPVGDRMTGASSPRAAQVTLHSMSKAGGIMRMREVTGGLAAPPGARVEVQPGGAMHLMLIGLKRPLRAGEHVPVTLRFSRAGEVHADFLVRAQGAQAPPTGAGGRDHMTRMGGR